MFEYDGKTYSIECQPQDYTIVLDISESCSGVSQNAYCLGVVSDNDGPLARNCSGTGGNEGESYSFSYSLTPTGRTISPIGGGSAKLFPGEAAFTLDRINWRGETRVVPFNLYGVPFFSIIRGWSRQRYRFFRFFNRTRPVVSIAWLGAGGSGAELSANLSQHADVLGQPYWKVEGVSVTSGGGGYSPFSDTLSAVVENGSGTLPAVRVSQWSYTPPTMSATVAAASTTPAQLSVSMRQALAGLSRYIGLDQPTIIPMWQVDSVAVQDGGGGYPPNQTIVVSFSITSGYYSPSGMWWHVPYAFFAQTNSIGVVQSVIHQMPSPNLGGVEGRGFVGPTASAVAATIDGPSEIVGLAGYVVTRTRAEPTVVASPPAGVTGAVLSVSLEKAGDGDTAYWYVDAVVAAAAGSGWNDGDPIAFTAQAGEDVVTQQVAVAVANVSRVQPTVTASASGGSGATFGVTIAPNGTTPQTWSVTGVTVTNGGTGYPSSGYLDFSAASGDTADEGAQVEFRSGRMEPTLAVQTYGSGSGAVLAASLASATGWNGQTYWYVDGISITNGGSGYSEYDPIYVIVTDGESAGWWWWGPNAEVSSVDENGAITGIAFYGGDEYYKSNGIIQSVMIDFGGAYYRKQLGSISVTSGGKYYRQSFSQTTNPLPPLECLNYPGGWESHVFESADVGESGNPELRISPRVGEQYTFKDVFMIALGDIYEFPEIGHTATRICEDPEITVTFQ
jgi:hypothetical protein